MCNTGYFLNDNSCIYKCPDGLKGVKNNHNS